MASKGGKEKASKDGLQGDLVKIMYGYGDEKRPRQDTVDLLESMVQEYIFEVCRQTFDTPVGENNVNEQGLMYNIRRQENRWIRLKELLKADAAVKDANSQKITRLAEEDSGGGGDAGPSAPPSLMPGR